MMRRIAVPAALCCCLSVVAAFASEKTFTAIDLKGHVNHKLGDPNDDDAEGNQLALPAGEQTVEGIKMQIGERIVQLGCKLIPNRPEKVEGIRVEGKFKKLHILHATAFGNGEPGSALREEDGTFLGEYRINYDDKSSENVAIEYGKDVRDWWFREKDEGTSRAKVAWTGDNDLARKFSCRVRLYLTTWTNPKPDQKVVSIDFIGRKGEIVAAPFCVAITAEED